MKKKSMQKFYRLMEDRLREDLEASTANPEVKRPSMQKVAASFPALTEKLKGRYLKSRNPVRVWDALLQLHFAQVQQRELVVPIWIRAYLVTAAQGIMGRAVDFEEAPQEVGRHGRKLRKSRVPEPEFNPDGSVTRYSDRYGGTTAPERNESANEALRFTTTRGGTNPFLSAHRAQVATETVRQTDALRNGGRTTKAALELLDDPLYKHVADPTRKLRRDRGRSGET